MLGGDHTGAQRLLEEAVAVPAAPDVAAQAAGLLATIAANAGRADDAIEWARRALALGVESGTDTAYAMTMLMSGLAMEGDLVAAENEIARGPRGWVRRPTVPMSGTRGAVLALWDGRLEEADRTLAHAASTTVGWRAAG